MLTPRPDKYRGAYFSASILAGVGDFSAILYVPPASGAEVELVSTDVVSFLRVGPANVVAPAFSSGLGVVSSSLAPAWGPDYALTGSVVAGSQVGAGLTDGIVVNSNQSQLGIVVFPPNVLVVQRSTANLPLVVGIMIREFLSAEELQRWPSSRA